MGIIRGEKNYVSIAVEDVWGVANGSPVYFHVPVDSYGTDMARTDRFGSPALGVNDEFHHRAFNGMPSGQMVLPFYGWEPPSTTKSIAQWIQDWALDNADQPASFMAELAIGPDIANVLHNGLRVNQYTLAGDAASGRVMQTLDVMGKSETAVVTAQTLPTDRNKIVEADYSDCTFSIDTVAIKLASFNLSQQNSLSAEYLNGTTPDYLTAGTRVRTCQFVPVQLNDVWGAKNRAFAESEHALQIVVKGRHNGTAASGTYWQCTIDIARAAFLRPDENRAKELKKQPLNFRILKPQSSTAAIVCTWALV